MNEMKYDPDNEKTSISTITYALEKEDHLAQYVIEYALEICGYHSVFKEHPGDGEKIDLYYGNEADRYVTRLSIRNNVSDLIHTDILNEGVSDYSKPRIEFDLINAIGQFLTDQVNRKGSETHVDAHGRLLFKFSYQYLNSLANVPIVNIYIRHLKRSIEEITGKIGIPLWPTGKQCAIILSHDVDRPVKYPLLFNFQIPKNIRIYTSPSFYLNYYRDLKKYIRDKNPNDFWLFNEIMKEESERGFKSTFFFCSSNYYSKEGSPYDVQYDINRPEFDEIFQRIVSNGFEIGLHAAYDSHKEIEYLKAQMYELSKRSKSKIKGLRHHYWMLGSNEDNTLKMHSAAGFLYDCSLAFNYDLGFRRNVALPFYPYDSLTERPINCLQVPTFCMDGSLMYDSSDHDLAISRISPFIEELARIGGLGAIDWHVRTSYPKNEEYLSWGKVYLSILDLLAIDPRIWVTNMSSVESWISSRRNYLARSTDNSN